MKKETPIQWVPSHCGLTDNEEVDLLAKKAAINLQSTQTLTQLKGRFFGNSKPTMTHEFDASRNELFGNPQLLSDSPSQSTVTAL